MRVMHQQERAEHGERQWERHNQDAAEVHQKNDMRQRDEDDLFDQRVTQGTDRGLNQFRPVVEGNDVHARRQAGFNLPDLLFHAVDYVLRVLARPGHNHSADCLGAVLHERCRPEGVADLDRTEVFYVNRRPIVRSDDDVANVVQIFYEAQSTHDGPRAVLRDYVSTDVRIAGHDSANDRAERQPIAAQTIWIDVDLVLLDCAPYARHLRDAGNRIQLVAHIPVLQRTQVAQAEPAAFHRVPEHVTDTGRVRAKCWDDARRKLLADKVEALQHARAGKVKVNIILKDHENHREAESRRRAHDLDSRQALQVDGKRIRDLVLHFLRTPPGPIGEDNHLVVAQVRNRIDGCAQHGPQSPARD